MPRECYFTRVLAEPALNRAMVSAVLVPIHATVSVVLAPSRATVSAVQVPIRGPSVRNYLRVTLLLFLSPSLQP
jgi:hypothetical protein